MTKRLTPSSLSTHVMVRTGERTRRIERDQPWIWLKPDLREVRKAMLQATRTDPDPLSLRQRVSRYWEQTKRGITPAQRRRMIKKERRRIGVKGVL